MCGIARRDTRVPVRAASRQLSATPTGGSLKYQNVSRRFGDEGKPRPYNTKTFSRSRYLPVGRRNRPAVVLCCFAAHL
ncbi:MAG: hypothetical protein LBQ66_06855 [Planctomycetaceae bacterium]|nr:hypothetical protein [Planctomycetaceae bacterium]